MEFERRYTAELRAEGRRLTGVVMKYGDVSPSHRERFEPGALRMAESIHLDWNHDPERAVAWFPGGGLAIENGRDSVTMRAELPPIPAADKAIAEIKAGRANGLSVEFRAVKERRDGDIRVIEDAILSGIGIVKAPSYGGSRVEARRRSGRTMRATIPAGRSVECRCSGAECKFAKMVKEGMEQAFNSAFRQFEREVVAGFGSYDMPLASASSGTLRGRILGNGDGEVEIDLPADSVGAATLAAHEAAGVIVRPHIDAAAAESTVEGGTRIYETMPIRAFLVSATDAREGLASAGAGADTRGAGARQRAAPAGVAEVAVTLTAAELAEAVGVDETLGTRLLAVAAALVTRYAPDAPDAVANEAAIRTAGWLAEQPSAAITSETEGDIRTSYAPTMLSALRHSGAMALLSAWKIRRAGQI